VAVLMTNIRQTFGQPPMQYLTSGKIDLAKHILRTRSMNISDLQVGTFTCLVPLFHIGKYD